MSTMANGHMAYAYGLSYPVDDSHPLEQGASRDEDEAPDGKHDQELQAESYP